MLYFGFYVAREAELEAAYRLNTSIKQQYTGDEIKVMAFTPHESVKAQLLENGIETHGMTVQERYFKIPFVNKIFAAAVFETICEKMGNGTWIWMDVDSYVVKPLPKMTNAPLVINSVDKKNIGVSYTQPLTKLWKWVYREFDLDALQKPVKTQITKERIHPYFNVGMVVINESRGIFNATRQAIEKFVSDHEMLRLIMENDLYAIFMHQAVFTGAVLKAYSGELESLPKGVNYPWHLNHEDLDHLSKAQLISFRYDFMAVNWRDFNSI